VTVVGTLGVIENECCQKRVSSKTGVVESECHQKQVSSKRSVIKTGVIKNASHQK
jgi:hypothetical protein